MRSGHIEHVPHMIPLCISRLDGVPTFGDAHTSIFAQFEDDNKPLVSAMNVRRIVIFRVHTESDSIESVRAHATRILPKPVRFLLHRGQRLLQIRDQVILVFDPARQPYQALGDA